MKQIRRNNKNDRRESITFQEETHTSIENREIEKTNGCQPWKSTNHCLKTSQISTSNFGEPKVQELYI